MAEALVTPCSIEGRHRIVNRPTIVALGLVCLAEVLVRLQDHIPTSRGECEGALGRGDRLVIITRLVEIVCEKDQDLSQPTRVAESLGESLGLA